MILREQPVNIGEAMLSSVCYHGRRGSGDYSVPFFRSWLANRYVIIRKSRQTRLKKAKGRFPMPTQEERLDTLDSNLKQFKTETVEAYGEMAVELTMVKGLTEDAIKRLTSIKDQIELRFERVDSRFERVDIRFERVDIRFDGIDAHLESMDGRLDRLENLLVQVLARLPEKP